MYFSWVEPDDNPNGVVCFYLSMFFPRDVRFILEALLCEFCQQGV